MFPVLYFFLSSTLTVLARIPLLCGLQNSNRGFVTYQTGTSQGVTDGVVVLGVVFGDPLK